MQDDVSEQRERMEPFRRCSRISPKTGRQLTSHAREVQGREGLMPRAQREWTSGATVERDALPKHGGAELAA